MIKFKSFVERDIRIDKVINDWLQERNIIFHDWKLVSRDTQYVCVVIVYEEKVDGKDKKEHV